MCEGRHPRRIVDGGEVMTAASAAYLNPTQEPTVRHSFNHQGTTGHGHNVLHTLRAICRSTAADRGWDTHPLSAYRRALAFGYSLLSRALSHLQKHGLEQDPHQTLKLSHMPPRTDQASGTRPGRLRRERQAGTGPPAAVALTLRPSRVMRAATTWAWT